MKAKTSHVKCRMLDDSERTPDPDFLGAFPLKGPWGLYDWGVVVYEYRYNPDVTVCDIGDRLKLTEQKRKPPAFR